MEDRDYNPAEDGGNASSEDGGISAESIVQELPAKQKKIAKTKCHKKKMCSLKRSQEEIDQKRGYSIQLKGGGTGGILGGASLGGSGKAKKVYKCTHCDYNSSSSSMICTHVNVEHNKVRLECTECDYWTLNATNLLSHRYAEKEIQ